MMHLDFLFFFFFFLAVNKNVQTLLEKLTLTFIQIKISSYLFYYCYIILLRLLAYSIFRYTLQSTYCNIGILHRRKTIFLGLLFKLQGWNKEYILIENTNLTGDRGLLFNFSVAERISSLVFWKYRALGICLYGKYLKIRVGDK